MGLGDIEGYVYQADLWCPPCISRAMGASGNPSNVEVWLGFIAAEQGINREYEYSFDSGDFPKVVLGQELTDVGYQHCAGCGDCLAHDLSDCEQDQEDPDEPEHADYPHEPGQLYDCEACEGRCHCSHMPGATQCVFCALLQERHQL